MRSRVVLFALAALGAGCATEVERDERDDGRREGARPGAVVLVESSLGDDGVSRSRSTAVFGVADARELSVAAAWAGAAPVVPAPGTCERTRSARLERVRERLELVPVRQISVGDERLIARAFPDLGNGLGGVVYTSRDRDAAPGAGPLRVSFDDGSEATVPLDVPRPAADPIVALRDGGLFVAWSAEDEVDLELVDVTTRGEVRRCVPSLGTQVSAPGDADSVVTIHRVRRARDAAAGVEVHFDAVREVKVGG